METGLCDIYPYEFIPFWQTISFYLLIGTLFVTLLIGISIWYYRRRLKHRLLVPPWQRASKALAKIGGQQLTTKREYKAAYFALTTVLKTYLYEENGWPVLHKTDTELMRFLYDNKIESKILLLCEQIIQGMLEIKFADAQALEENFQRHIQCAQEFIEQTVKKQPHENRK